MENIKLSISIMAHPSRQNYFDYLNKMLGNPPISLDSGSGLWENAKRAWRMYDKSANWHIVIQDDAIICDDFKTKAIEAIAASQKIFKRRPHLCNFYYDQMLTPSNADEIIKQGHITRSKVCWAVAICMPVHLINEMIEFGDKLNIKEDDEKITLFLKSKGLKVYFPIPSLVDHRVDTASLVGNDNSVKRKAWRYIG